jgi:hypothetical protein
VLRMVVNMLVSYLGCALHARPRGRYVVLDARLWVGGQVQVVPAAGKKDTARQNIQLVAVHQLAFSLSLFPSSEMQTISIAACVSVTTHMCSFRAMAPAQHSKSSSKRGVCVRT